MLTVSVEAGRTRIHLMHELFFAIARALPWDSLVQRYLEALFGAHDYAWPRPGEPMAMADLAAAFAVAPNLLARHVDQWLTADVWEDRRLAQDFRAALLSLCLSRLEAERLGNAPDRWRNGCAARRWRPRRCAPPASRFAFPAPMRAPCWPRCAISCARPASPGCSWCWTCGGSPAPRPPTDMLRYSPAAVMDAYEVLRETHRRCRAFARPVRGGPGRRGAGHRRSAPRARRSTRRCRCACGPMCGPATGRTRWPRWYGWQHDA